MTNNISGKLYGVFGKTLVIAFFTLVMAAASYAQQGNLYEANGRAYFGRITAYTNTWRIELPGSAQEIKIYSCRDTGNKGITCYFTQFSNGRVNYSGEAQIYQSGAIYLRWTHDLSAGVDRSIDTGWKGYQVR